jgi:hypothetical protein
MLPVEIYDDKISADYKNGLILITMPNPKKRDPGKFKCRSPEPAQLKSQKYGRGLRP